MIKEIIKQKEDSLILHVQKSKLHSIQKASIEKTGLRLYRNGYIGVAGAIGPVQDIDLEKKAKEILAMEIPYLPDPTQNLSHQVRYDDKTGEESLIISMMEMLLENLRIHFPDFSFSHHIRWTKRVDTMENDAGLSLSYQDAYLEISLLYKHVNSVELIDGSLGCVCRQFDQTAFLQYCQDILASFMRPAHLPSGSTLPVVFTSGFQTLFSRFCYDLNSRNLATKGSRLHDKIGIQHCHHDFTFYQSHHPENLFRKFYDAEGTFHPDSEYRVPLIQNGLIKQGYSDKRTAREFSLPLTGSSVSDFDGLPTLGLSDYEIEPGQKSIAELLEGRTGIFVDIASGGDFTPQGDFATPVQKAYLMDGTNIIGRLPPLQLNSHIDAMFGHDFIGVSQTPLFPLNQDLAVIITMPVTLI